MGNDGRVTVGLPVDLSEAVDHAIKSGEYTNASEVILDALKLWKEGREHFGLSDQQIGALWDAGIASGPGRFASIDELIRVAEARAKPKD